jgi:LmbE family N-acetylglucosaminyl deacetylase
MSVLVVVAHPDDEVLGAGGTIYTFANRGMEVNVCVMSAQAQARAFRPSDTELEDDTNSSMNSLGVKKRILGDFPNIELNKVPHLELVKFIESAIIETAADIVITHHPSDLNNDHLHTSLACQAAVRLFQRRKEVKPLKELLYMEVLSATDWSMNPSFQKFNPNLFIEIGKEGLKKKMDALAMYRDVMREYPHPRSRESLRGLAAYRGSQAAFIYAEAFESAFRRDL